MISFPYTSVKTMSGSTPQFDRAIDSKIKRLYNILRYTQGVAIDIGGGFQVLADSGMKVKVHCDGAWGHVFGDFCYEDQEYRSITIDPSDSIYDRIDRIVLRNDISQSVRATDLYYVKGTPSASPEPPALTTTPEIHERCLAQIRIPKESSTISQSQITDTRLNTELCGVMTNAFGDIDASQFFSQLQQITEDLQDAIHDIEAGSGTMLQVLYDPQKKAQDIFAYGPHLYKATFLLNDWDGSGPYTQTVVAESVDGGPQIKSNSIIMSTPTISDDLLGNADMVQAAVLVKAGEINPGDGKLTCSTPFKPNADVELYFQARKGE